MKLSDSLSTYFLSQKSYSCMSLYMRWPLTNFYTFICWTSFFSVKSSCALVTREEMVISYQVRNSYRGGNGNFLPGDECTWQFHWKNRFCAYINSNRNRFSEWPLMSGIEISSSRGLKKTLKLALGMKKFQYPTSGSFGNPLFFYENFF